MIKKGQVKKLEGVHQRKVSHMIKNVDGSAGLLHRITMPAAWRGGVQILEEEEDARPMGRCKEKRKEWARHWQFGANVQIREKKPWRMMS